MATLLLAVGVVSDNLFHREPLLAAVGALTALFAFATVWPYYHGTDAALSLAGLLVALVGVCWPGGVWAVYPLRWRFIVLLGVGVAFDDVIEHAFGVWTPLDSGFNQVAYLLP